ncbi:MAG: hypothetical protein ABIP74_02475 [Candidatus Saccharimonas sp.]
MQVVEACQAAALGNLWQKSPNHKFGIKDPELTAHIETCIRGSGLKKNDPSAANVLGYPLKGKPKVLQYIMVLGTDTGTEDNSLHVFNATRTGAGLGFVAFDEDVQIDKISSFYQEFGQR